MVTSKPEERLPTRMTSTSKDQVNAKINERLDKVESKVNILDARMLEMVQHQRVQTDLLQHLLINSGVQVPRPPVLDANKKGEKSSVLPSPAELVARIPPPYYSPAEAQLRKEREALLARLDALSSKGPSSKGEKPTSEGEPSTSKSSSLNVTVSQVLVPFQTLPSSLAKGFKYRHVKVPVKKVETKIFNQGDNSLYNDLVPHHSNLPSSPNKPNGKNKIKDDFPMPQPDQFKLMGNTLHLAKFGKNLDLPQPIPQQDEYDENGNLKPRKAAYKPVLAADDRGFRSFLARIKRNGVDIVVPPGHPLYQKARDEEGVDDLELVRLAAQLGADDEEASVEMQKQLLEQAQLNLQKPSEQVKEKSEKPKSTRVKKTRAGKSTVTQVVSAAEQPKESREAKRKISYDEIKSKAVADLTEEEMRAIKHEPIEFDMSNLPFPQYFMSKDDLRKEERAVRHKKRRPVAFSYEKKKVPLPIKPPSTEVEISQVPDAARVPKSDYAYAIHLTQQPKIELFLNEIDEVRGIAGTATLPDRLSFHYKNGYNQQWPIERILDQDYSVLKVIFMKMKNPKGYTQNLRTAITLKMEEITREWNTPSDRPKRINLPHQLCRVHEHPDWLMEFRDSQGVRRFFRMIDHAPKADVDTLRFMQMKLDPSDPEENAFRRQLQKFVDERLEAAGHKKKQKDEDNFSRKRRRKY